MNKLRMITMCLLTMMATSLNVKAQEVTITLMPGWNWISVPLMDTLDFQTAMGPVTPVDGDIIKSHWGSAAYSNGQWRGTISQFYPGYGYHYKSNRTEPVTLTFQVQQPSPQVVVTTSEPTDITATSAVVGGTVNIDEGNHVFVRGVCWGTEEMPTVDDNHISNVTGIGSFTDTLTELTPGTTYYVRAFVVTDYGLAYGEELSFTTENGGGDDHEYVDLGLPSGTLWATCNVGANAPEEYGDYFAWGETLPKDIYNWDTYQYCNGGYYLLTKYCYNVNYGYIGFTDNLTALQTEDDAATTNWGNDWRTPTKDDWQELYQNTTSIWTRQNDVNGWLFTALNGNNLFLPATGYQSGGIIIGAGSEGSYWSSSLGTQFPTMARCFCFDSDGFNMNDSGRETGKAVRAVRSVPQNNTPTGAINGKFTINDNGDQVYFSQGNLQYIGSASTPYWKFADNQWDYFGMTTGQNSSAPNVDRDLFGWGTSGYNHGANCYQPWSTSRNNSDYYAYGSSSNNLNDSTGMADWGYNPINNGGNQPNLWRTLTKNEWVYIFNTRATASGIRYAKAKVNGINGVILLPDDWSTSYYTLINTNKIGINFSSNSITAEQWNTLEQHGAVFLSAAGNRDEISVGNMGGYGLYWSASYFNGIMFNDSSLYPLIYNSCYYGLSVRLVCNAE